MGKRERTQVVPMYDTLLFRTRIHNNMMIPMNRMVTGLRHKCDLHSNECVHVVLWEQESVACMGFRVQWLRRLGFRYCRCAMKVV